MMFTHSFLTDSILLGFLGEPFGTLLRALVTFLGLYSTLLIIRVLLSWFPQVDWYNPIFSTLSQLTDPYLNLFRSIIPPIGGFDFSTILAFILLGFIRQVLATVAG